MPIPQSPHDPFSYAWDSVNNKSVWNRVRHAELFHSIRSAYDSKGSRLSKLGKLAGATLRGVAGAIPTPVVGGIVAAVESKIEGMIRSYYHDKNKGAASELKDVVKFEIKEMSVENLDRYRWKVSFATVEHNKVALNLQNQMTAYALEKKTCDAYIEYSLEAAQYIRRVDKLFTELLKLNGKRKCSSRI
jgi:hypothetical protein